MEEYTAQEIDEMVTGSQTLSSIEAYAFGFMTGFVDKDNVNGLLGRIMALGLDASQILTSKQKFKRFADLLYDLGRIQASEIDILTTYFQEIERKIEIEFPLLSKLQLFYLARFHSLYNDADIKKQMIKANIQNKSRTDNNNKYDPQEILLRIKGNLDKEINNRPPIRDLRNLNIQKTFRVQGNSPQVKIETKQEEMETHQAKILTSRNQSEPSPPEHYANLPKEIETSNHQINIEIERPGGGQDRNGAPEFTPQSIHKTLQPQGLVEKRAAKKTGKNPPKKPESPIKHQKPSNFQSCDVVTPTNSFSLELLAETFKLNAQIQSQYAMNTLSFPAADSNQLTIPPPLSHHLENIKPFNHVGMEKTVNAAPPTLIDLEEGEEEIIFEKKIDMVVEKQEEIHIDLHQQSNSQQQIKQIPIIEPPNHSHSELLLANKTSQKVQIDSNDSEESKNITKLVLGALLSNKKLNSPDKISNTSEKNSPDKPQKNLGCAAEKSVVPLEKSEQEEQKTSQDYDVYDISYCSSDDVSYMSSPRLPDGTNNQPFLNNPKELVLSSQGENELDEERELSFDENINVFCRS